MKLVHAILQRRSFIARFSGATAAVLAPAEGPLRAQSAALRDWQAGREAKDDWLDNIPGKHRMMFDSVVPEGFASALMYANNFFIGNRNGYALQDADLAVVVVARHHSTPFAFNDAIWKKYGTTISRLSNFTDPATKQPPSNNVHLASGALSSLLERGVHLAVCEMATKELAGSIASDAATDEQTVFNEMAANLVRNSHLVPTGIVAVNRAQEKGYAFVNC